MKLIISRINEWFDTDYPELDVYYVCVKLLEKLNRNRIKGIVLINYLSLVLYHQTEVKK